MKQLFFASIFVTLFILNAFAQAPETFDISTYQAPKGWTKQTGQDSILFSIENNGSYCLITLFRSTPGLPSSKENFDAAWTAIVKEAVAVSAAPEMFPTDNKGEWQVAGGFSPFEKNGEKGVAILYTASGYGRMVNAFILTNTQAFEPEATAFLESISFKKPAAEAQQPSSTIGPNGGPSLTDNFWKQGAIRQGMLGQSGLSTGTFSKVYQFHNNGTYKFSREDMQLAAPKYYLENEEGIYTVNGNIITLTPRKASFSQHRLSKTEPPLKSGNLPLSTAQYRFEFWRYDDNWRLLLSPVDGNETKRDGTFSFYRNGEPQRTYQYHLVDSAGRLMR